MIIVYVLKSDQDLIQASWETDAVICSMILLHVINVLTLSQAMPGARIIMMTKAGLGPILIELIVESNAA